MRYENAQASSWLVGWLVVGWLVGWLMCYENAQVSGWLVGWLVGWLAGWLVCYKNAQRHAQECIGVCTFACGAAGSMLNSDLNPAGAGGTSSPKPCLPPEPCPPPPQKKTAGPVSSQDVVSGGAWGRQAWQRLKPWGKRGGRGQPSDTGTGPSSGTHRGVGGG